MRGWFAVLVLCAMGCGGVGRAVVGEHGGDFGTPECDLALECEPLPISEPELVPEGASPIDLSKCEPAGGSMCSGSATMPSVQCAAVTADGLERGLEDTAGLAQLGCSTLQLKHSSDEPGSARIELAVWNRVNVTIESTQPATLELVGGIIEHVSLVLQGPITLRVLDTALLRDVRVQSEGAAQIELVRVRGDGLAIDAPTGAVLVRRSTLDQIRVNAQRIDLESSYVSDAIWAAEWLNGADATLRRIRSDVARSVLSACDVALVRFAGCRSWTSVQGSFTDVQLAACSEEVSVYGSSLVHSQLAGDLLLDGASLGMVVLGLGEVGSIAAWDSSLGNVTFCADQHALSLGGSSSARCARCDLAQEPVEPDACAVPGSEARVERSETCGMLAAPPLCDDPQPERMRPPRF